MGTHRPALHVRVRACAARSLAQGQIGSASDLTDDARREAMCRRAYAVSRTMTWERTAQRYMSAFEHARHGHWLKVRSEARPISPTMPAGRRCAGAPMRLAER